MPEHERQKLRAIIATAHADGQRVRFWATSDDPGEARENVWKELLDARLDFINTDHLSDLERFLLENDPNPSEPHVTGSVQSVAEQTKPTCRERVARDA